MSTELLGNVVTWTVSSSGLPLGTIRQALEDAGLDPEIAKELNARSTFSRAARHLKENRTIDRVNNASDDTLTFQFTKKTDRGSSIEFDMECLVHLNLETGVITCRDSSIESEARLKFTEVKDLRTASDITRLVQKLFRENADLFPINPKHGGAYFVPDQHSTFTERVQDFIFRVGGQLHMFPVPKGTEQGNQSVMNSVATGLESLLVEMDKAIEDWTSDTRPSTVQRAVDKFQEMKIKADTYASYLGARQDEIAEKLKKSVSALVTRSNDLGLAKDNESSTSKAGAPADS